ncbi:Transcription initiation factor IIB [archaeon GW2011_AR15]|nr:Transcription initiation factor IIB [archaeon GW2011_AR15]
MIKDMHYKKCPECGAELLNWNKEKGEVTCKSCGLVLDDKLFDFGQEWREFDSDGGQSRRRTGAPLTYTQEDRGLGTTIGTKSDLYKLSKKDKDRFYRLRLWQRRVSTAIESNLRLALSEIKRIVSVLGLPGYVEEEISRIYTEAVQRGLVRGHSTEAVVAGVVYAVLRMYDIPRTLNEVSEVTGIDKKKVAKNFKYVSRNLNIRTLPIDPMNYVTRFASELKLEPKTQTKALDIVQIATKEEITSGRSPKGIAAGALYIASKIHNEKKTQAEIAKVADVTEVTVRNSYKELIDSLSFLDKEMEKARAEA